MKNINIAELLKDCPKGMELYSPIFGEVYLDEIRPHLAIVVTTNKEQGDCKEEFLYDGRYGMNGECMLFQSKSKTTWEGFTPPCKFKDGDIVAASIGNWIGITTGGKSGEPIPTYCVIKWNGDFEAYPNCKEKWRLDRFATEEEKQKLFDAIKANGYKWNPDTKTLEKLPKFKVGDRVKHISACTVGIVVKVADKGYHIDYPTGEGVCYVSFTLEKDYELAPNKFDITTLKPFDKVLVRYNSLWHIQFFERYDKEELSYPFVCLGGSQYQNCIPYEENKHLLDTTDDCDDFYKTW